MADARQEHEDARGRSLRELYLVALAREPNSTEIAAAGKHLTRRQGLAARRSRTLGWALVNAKEFLFRH